MSKKSNAARGEIAAWIAAGFLAGFSFASMEEEGGISDGTGDVFSGLFRKGSGIFLVQYIGDLRVFSPYIYVSKSFFMKEDIFSIKEAISMVIYHKGSLRTSF